MRVAQAVAAHFSKGQGEAAQLPAAGARRSEDVVASMTAKLVEAGKEELPREGAVGDAVAAARRRREQPSPTPAAKSPGARAASSGNCSAAIEARCAGERQTERARSVLAARRAVRA